MGEWVELKRGYGCPGDPLPEAKTPAAPQQPPPPTPCQAAAGVSAKRLPHLSAWTLAAAPRAPGVDLGKSAGEPVRDMVGPGAEGPAPGETFMPHLCQRKAQGLCW